MIKRSIAAICMILHLSGCLPAQQGNQKMNNSDEAYFGQAVPGEEPMLFAPGVISKPDRYEFGCTLSRDGTEFYYGVDNNGVMEIHFTTQTEGEWSASSKLFNTDSISYNDPMLSPDELRLYFISNRALSGDATKSDIDLWYVARADKQSAWSEPINLGSPISSPLNEYYASFTSEGTLYFASKDKTEGAPRYAYDIYRSEYMDGQFQLPEKLPETINTNRYEADVFIAPDESYMIFCSIRRNGLGQGDLYISFNDGTGNWTEAVNMGAPINTEGHELCPVVSPDGQYLLYTSREDIYWVSTAIIERYRSVDLGRK